MSSSSSPSPKRRLVLTATLLCAASLAFVQTTQQTAPSKGQTAPNFTLRTIESESVSLYELTREHKVVLVALRGWPGYQCPICSQQVGELISRAKDLADANAHVLLVYPGPREELEAHAKSFLKGSTLPDNFSFVLDPDYTFTNLYSLRWDADGETAYPSTFVIDRESKITYAKVSKTHGGRAPIGEVIDAVKAIQ